MACAEVFGAYDGFGGLALKVEELDKSKLGFGVVGFQLEGVPVVGVGVIEFELVHAGFGHQHQQGDVIGRGLQGLLECFQIHGRSFAHSRSNDEGKV